MPTPFLSSEEYDERAHALYNEGKYDDALALLREALSLYPNAVELHVGVGYSRLAREEYAWARRAFESALVFDPDHEDALAGLGEVLLKFGQVDAGLRAFEQTVTLGYDDDVDLMLQIGRALFREDFVEPALTFFERAVAHADDSAEAVACVGYAQHRLGRDGDAVASLNRALMLDPGLMEARVYLANLRYDAGELNEALMEFERTEPADHWDELGIWRLMELKKSVYKLEDTDGELKPWEARLVELANETDDIDDLLEEIEQAVMEQDAEGPSEELSEEHGQLETLGSLLTGLVNHQQGEQAALTSTDVLAADSAHRVIMRDGSVFEGTWEEIVRALRDARDAGRPLQEYMAAEARRFYGATGRQVASDAPEAFLRGGADAGMLRIDR